MGQQTLVPTETLADQHNKTSVSDFVEQIQSQISAANIAWWEVCKLLHEVDKQYGFSSREMGEVIRACNISRSKANKLVSISKSPNIRENSDLLCNRTSWTVLYEITLLSTEEFEVLKERAEHGAPVTVALINSIRGKPKHPKSSIKPLATLEIDPSKFSAWLNDGGDPDLLSKALSELSLSIPGLQISLTSIVDDYWKSAEREINAREKAYQKLLKKKIRDEIANYKRRAAAWQQFNNPTRRKKLALNRPPIGVFENEEQATEAILSDPRKNFPGIDFHDFDENDLLRQAG